MKSGILRDFAKSARKRWENCKSSGSLFVAVLNVEVYNLMENPLLHDKKLWSMKRRQYKSFNRDLYGHCSYVCIGDMFLNIIYQ